MSTSAEQASQTGTVQVRYWASARAAAGVDTESVTVTGPVSVTDLINDLIAQRSGPGAAELSRVLGVCSVLVGDQPTRDRETPVGAGSTVEFLPPFAGG